MEKGPSSAPLLLEVENAEICFRGDSKLVRVAAVDWRVDAGSYWVVGGSPDSGKSDLLATVAGLQRPASGSVRLFGRNVSTLAEPELLKQRTRVGFVFKSGGRIFSDLTVAENIALPLRYHRNLASEDALETVHALLKLTELGDIGSDSPAHLGFSMQQRLALARALALKPDILFLDEPLAGLGRHRQWWVDFLQQLTMGIPFMDGRKAAVVVTTNDFAPWAGRPVCFALIRNKRWRALGEQSELPTV